MKLFKTRIPHLRIQPWLAAVLFSFPLASACSDDEAAPAEPTVFSVEIADLEGDDGVASPRCDGTLAVTVRISPAALFKLRPLHACGSSSSCGYVRAEALTSDGEVLAQATSVTTTALLRIEPTRLPELAGVRASLIRGADGEVVTNSDGGEVSVQVEPTVTLPEGCDDLGAGGAANGGAANGGAANGGAANGGAANGGAGGQAGAPGELGGAGGAPAGGAPTDAGAPNGGGEGGGGAG
jgi:hypothetical protein